MVITGAILYGIIGGATWFKLMEPYVLIDTPRWRCRWVFACALASLLWPLAWIGLLAAVFLLERERVKGSDDSGAPKNELR